MGCVYDKSTDALSTSFPFSPFHIHTLTFTVLLLPIRTVKSNFGYGGAESFFSEPDRLHFESFIILKPKLMDLVIKK